MARGRSTGWLPTCARTASAPSTRPASLIGYWRLFGLDLAGLRVRLYSGISLAAGNAYVGEQPMTVDSLLMSGSLWVGAMTPLGPARFAWGLTEGGRDRFYILIGDRF